MALFEQTRDINQSKQQVFIEQNCDDPDVASQLARMLTVDQSSSSIFDKPLSARVRSLSSWDLKNLLGKTLGDFRINQLIHEGTFSAVFRVKQSAPIVRDAVIKVIHSHTPSEYVDNFFQEQKALAALSHPNIIKIHAVEKLSSNETCAIMEYIDGLKLDEYCTHYKLDLEQRLELFIKICDAISYSHQHNIIHRDIKPPNILVRKINSNDVPTVIDFGISTSIKYHRGPDPNFEEGARATPRTVQSAMGTPQYMSPEHLSGRVDTRADTYSLGVLLFSMLFGKVPFDWDEFLARDNEGRRDMIANFKLLPPSQYYLGLSLNSRANVSVELKAENTAQRAPFGKELDWIYLRATNKDLSQRYQTVEDLAGDIRLYRQGLPPQAAPKSSLYLIENFISRQRKSVAYSMLFVAVSVAFFLTLSYLNQRLDEQVNQTQKQKIAATQEQQNSLLVSKLANEFIALRDPYSSGNHSLDNLEQIIRAGVLKNLGDENTDLKTTQEMVLNLAEAYSFSSDPEKAWRIVDIALENVADEDYGFRIQANVIGAEATYFIGKLARSDDYAREAYQLTSDHSSSLELKARAARALAAIFGSKGEYQPALKLIDEALNIARSTEGFPRLELSKILYTKTRSHVFFREKKEALETIQEAISISRELLDSDHPILLTNLHQYAQLLSLNDPDTAVTIAEDTHTKLKARLGEDHPKVIGRTNGLALIYGKANMRAKAIDMLLGIRPLLRKIHGEASPQFQANTGNLAAFYVRTGQLDKALNFAQMRLASVRKYNPGNNQQRLSALTRLVEVYIAKEEWPIAGRYATEHYELSQNIVDGQASDSTRLSLVLLYDIALNTKDYKQASRYAQSHASMVHELSPGEQDYVLMARAMELYPAMKDSVTYEGYQAEEMTRIYNSSLELDVKRNRPLTMIKEWMQKDNELVSLLSRK